MFIILGTIFRILPEFKGKRRLARIIFSSYIKKKRDIFIKGKYGCCYLLPNLQESVAFELFINGIYEIETNDFLCNIIPKGGIYFDIGANIGSVSIPLCKKRPDIDCFAIEASEWVFKYLKQNIALNGLGEQVKLVNKAINDTGIGEVSFYTSEEVFGKGLMSPVFSSNPIKVECTSISKLTKEFLLTGVDVIKIDIEGFEKLAFLGGRELLMSEEAPLILFEFVSWAEKHAGFTAGDAQVLLMSWGYTLFQLNLNGSLTRLENIITEGGAMIIACKKNLERFQ